MLDWQSSAGALQAGPFRISRSRDGWVLLERGRERSSHRTAAAARGEAELLLVRNRRNHALKRIGLLLLVTLLLMLVTTSMRFTVNEGRAEAQALGGEMEAAYQALRDGTATVADVDAHGALQASHVTLGTGEELTALVGTAGGECYALFWPPDGTRWARVLARSLPCEPGPHIAQPNERTWIRKAPPTTQHLALAPRIFDWDAILPPATKQREWWLPATVALAAAALMLLTRASVIALTGTADAPDR